MRASPGLLLWREPRGHPKLHVAIESKPDRHDAYDLDSAAVDLYEPVDDLGIPAETAGPESFSDDGHVRVGVVFFGGEPAPENRLNTQQRPGVGGQVAAAHLFRR